MGCRGSAGRVQRVTPVGSWAGGVLVGDGAPFQAGGTGSCATSPGGTPPAIKAITRKPKFSKKANGARRRLRFQQVRLRADRLSRRGRAVRCRNGSPCLEEDCVDNVQASTRSTRASTWHAVRPRARLRTHTRSMTNSTGSIYRSYKPYRGLSSHKSCKGELCRNTGYGEEPVSGSGWKRTGYGAEGYEAWEKKRLKLARRRRIRSGQSKCPGRPQQNPDQKKGTQG